MNVSARPSRAAVVARRGSSPSAKSANTSSATSASSRSAQSASRASSSSRFRKDPVGLPGLTTTRARVRGVSALRERRHVDVPLAVVRERVAAHGDRLEPGQELEQRIARPRDQHLVAGVAQQLEQEAVGLAGAGVEQHAVGAERGAAAREVGGDGGARGGEAEGRRLVAPGLVPCQRREQVRGIGQRGACRVRERQVESVLPSARRAASRSASRLGRRSNRVRSENIDQHRNPGPARSRRTPS